MGRRTAARRPARGSGSEAHSALFPENYQRFLWLVSKAHADAMGRWNSGAAAGEGQREWENDGRVDLRSVTSSARQLPYHLARQHDHRFVGLGRVTVFSTCFSQPGFFKSVTSADRLAAQPPCPPAQPQAPCCVNNERAARSLYAM